MDGAFLSQRGENFDGRRGFRGTAENAKTKLCTRWMEGECRFGDRCNFAHGEHELRKGPGLDSDGGQGGYAGGGGRGSGRGGSYGPGGVGYGGRGGPGGGRGYGGRGRPAEGHDPYAFPAGNNYSGMGAYVGGGSYGSAVGGNQGPYGGVPPGMTEKMWADQGYPTSGPNGWTMYRTKDTGEHYFHNHRTSVTTWDRPADWPAGGPM